MEGVYGVEMTDSAKDQLLVVMNLDVLLQWYALRLKEMIPGNVLTIYFQNFLVNAYTWNSKDIDTVDPKKYKNKN